MKKLYIGYKIAGTLRVLFLIASAILNVIGIVYMIQGINNWPYYINYAIYVLFLVLISSSLMGVFKNKIVNNALSFYLKEKDLLDSKILKRKDNQILIQRNDELLNIEMHQTKKGIGFVLAPAKVEWEGEVVDFNLNINKVNLNYMPNWELPSWNDKVDSTMENE